MQTVSDTQAILFIQGKYCGNTLTETEKMCETADKEAATDIADAVSRVLQLREQGIGSILLYHCSKTDVQHEEALHTAKAMVEASHLPFYMGGNIRRFEDIKKYIYAGAYTVLCDSDNETEMEAFQEGVRRFGEQKVQTFALKNALDRWQQGTTAISDLGLPYPSVSVEFSWEDVKTNPQGLLPVVTQDARTGEVLMVAYMNEEAFQKTVETGRMTYYSRSRNELWVKGLTSGNFQYVRSLHLDCDYDTLLAKVYPAGPACHTGANSCFFHTVLEKPTASDINPHTVLEKVMGIILDRKENPREGSYTNYLFDKGVDKILKKLGEEATEIVIAAKNPDKEEIKYEISDFLYHLMVLMAEKNIGWDEVMLELANR